MNTTKSDANAAEAEDFGGRNSLAMVFFRALFSTWRVPLLISSVLALLIAAAIAAAQFVFPTTTIFKNQFVFAFPDAGTGRYPNGQPMTLYEIIDSTVLAEVYDQLKIADYQIKRDDFFAAFSIRPFATTEVAIIERFRSQLADRRLTFAERERIEGQLKTQLEVAARNAAELTFSLRQRIRLPTELGRAIVAAVPLVWSRHSIETKGVLRLPGAYASQTILDLERIGNLTVPIAILATTEGVNRTTARLFELKLVPGVMSMRDPLTGKTLRDVDREFRDVELFQLNRTRTALALYDFGADNAILRGLVGQRVSDLNVEISALQKQSDAIGESLRNFSEAFLSLRGRGVERRSGGEPAVSLNTSTTPQMSDAFIDRIIELAKQEKPEVTFIAQMTNRQLEISERMVALRRESESWRELLDQLQAAGSRTVADEAVLAGLRREVLSLVTGANQIWSVLTRLEAALDAKRLGHTARLFIPLVVEDDVTVSRPFIRTASIAAAAVLTVCVFLALWLLLAFWRVANRLI